MTKEGTGKIIKMGSANTRYLTIPADVAKDDRFPFEDNEEVKVSIDDNKIVIEKLK